VLTNKRMYRAFLLLGEPRYIYRLPKREPAERLEAWLAWASRSRLKAFVKVARTIRQHAAGMLATFRLGISNGRLDALHSSVRLISHRPHGFCSAGAFIAMVYRCCAGITIALPYR
jgi:transposase